MKTLDGEDLVPSLFDELTNRRNLHMQWNLHWDTSVQADDAPEECCGFPAQVIERWEHTVHALFAPEHAGYAIEIILREGGALAARIAGTCKDQMETLRDMLRDALPQVQETPESVSVSFWYYGAQGPRETSRTLAIAHWPEVEANYAARVREALAPVMTDSYRPNDGGHLILWRGAPGTGKTWAIRSLMSSWRKWANFHYVTDPEHFFGSHADYMMRVILREGEEPTMAGDEPKWCLLILEDSGELLSLDAKERTGQALSRLLNVVDGLIGQGLRLQVLVTTNEDIAKLHPAVSRAGRCVMNLEFEPLSASESQAWIESQVLAAVERERVLMSLPSRPHRLCDLYAMVGGRPVRSLVATGFHTVSRGVAVRTSRRLVKDLGDGDF